ncbi:MAG: hypothetical protein N0C86_21620 [Candidatus Thiodiazotropha taylori]|nr:hypothetical protein [Candidatus Thiodiazotropha taylori]MCW4328598.1 hypothetical protein [Candidatus Thiodiazotropha taylori]
MKILTKTYAFDGITAEFSYSDGTGFQVSWRPDMPRFTNPQSQQDFLTKYRAARKAFLTEVATSLGKSMTVVDGDGHAEVFEPG